MPECFSTAIITTDPLTVHVSSTDGSPASGLSEYAFSGGSYTGYSATTKAQCQTSFVLPKCSYRFRTDKNATQFWSADGDACAPPRRSV